MLRALTQTRGHEKHVASRTNRLVQLAETRFRKQTGHISYYMVCMLCNRRLIVLQAKIPGGASKAAGIGHHTDGGLSENTIRGKRNKKKRDRVNEKQRTYKKRREKE